MLRAFGQYSTSCVVQISRSFVYVMGVTIHTDENGIRVSDTDTECVSPWVVLLQLLWTHEQVKTSAIVEEPVACPVQKTDYQ